MNINKKAIFPLVVAIAGFIMSPEFYNKLPDKYAHLIMGISIVLSTLAPQLFSKNDKEQQEGT